MGKWIINISFFFIYLVSGAQEDGLVAYVNFDDCSATDLMGNMVDSLGGSPSCDCGISGNGLKLDGVDDFISWSGSIVENLLTGDFTISFYIKEPVFAANQDLLSLREDCGIDSALAITYDPATQMLISQFLETSQRTSILNGSLEAMRCWHHIVFKKQGRNTSLFANGILLDERANTTPLKFVTQALLQIANSPCLGITEERFSGVIDELKVFDRALDFSEISALFVNPDRIQNPDVTILLGESVDINLGPTCADFFSWTPVNGVSDPLSAQPTITPDETAVFQLQMGDADCITSDSIRIVVVDPAVIDCNNVLLPLAFTPNGDGLNDDFGISNPIVIDGFISFEIYSRWGSKVFEATSKNDRWDGSFDGDEIGAGVFLYKVRYTCEGKDVLRSGSITVLR